MDLLLNILVILFLGLHFIFITAIVKGLRKNENNSDVNFSPVVSILIAARNEAHNIEKLLNSIKRNAFDKTNYEVIVVNDHSEDSTIDVVKTWMTNNTKVKLVLIPAKAHGKKNAILEGLEFCENAIILQTDADCEVPVNWIKMMSAQFVNTKTQLVAGPVQFSPLSSLFEKIQSIEFATLIASSIGLSRVGWSIMANAANLAYLKSSRDRFNFDEKSKSGDDVFFIQRLAKEAPESIIYLSHSEVQVKTKPVKTLKNFLQQRVRWASKTNEYPSLKGQLVALYILLLNVISVFVVVMCFINWANPIVPIAFLITKFTLDFSVLKVYYTQSLKQPLNAFHTLLLSVAYPFYVASVLGFILLGKTSWKGRKL